jgi:uncharacterized protein YbjT (DUF2867 family)
LVEDSYESRPTLVIAGATGFVGHHLIPNLESRFRIVALTRSASRPAIGGGGPGASINWRRCDLFSLEDVERELQGADYALYLVHSMLPGSRLTQARFEDLDLLLADNFARAAAANRVKQIVYLGGLLGREDEPHLSRHLQSRREVGDCLASRGTPVTALRAGLIVGAGGSSLRVLVNLVRRLPVMVLPRWTRSKTQVIAVADVVRAFESVLGAPAHYNRAYDLGNPQILTYRELILKTAAVLGRKPKVVSVPINSTRISELWVRLFSGAPAALVNPLIESLSHDMVVTPNPLNDMLASSMTPFETALKQSIDERGMVLPSPRAEFIPRDRVMIQQAKLVRSVQRCVLPKGWTVKRAADTYGPWLEQLFKGTLECKTDSEGGLTILWRFPRTRLLEMTRDQCQQDPSRQVFRLSRGLLVRSSTESRGTFEFREVLNGSRLITAVLNYPPGLPWYLYVNSQAIFHAFVMNRFNAYLRRQNQQVAKHRSSTNESSPPRKTSP